MGSLREELLEREAGDFVAIIEGDQSRVDRALAAVWEATLREGDHYRMIGTAILWCPQQTIALVVCRCIRLIVNRGSAEVLAALEITERWARNEAPIEDVWDAELAVGALAYRGNRIAELVDWVAGAAGNERPFDEEALRSACEAVAAVLALSGDAARPAIVQAFRETIPPPSLSALIAAHAARNAEE